MADNYGIGAVWSTVTHWSATSGGASKGAIPVDGEPVYLDTESASMTLDIPDAPAVGALSLFDMHGYRVQHRVFTMGANTIDVDGNVYLCSTINGDAGAEIQCSGDFEKDIAQCVLSDNVNILLDGSGTVTCNANAGGTVEVNTDGGTYTAVEPEPDGTAEWYSFTLADGTYVDGGLDHNIVSAISIAGTLTSTGKWTLLGDAGSGTVVAASYARTIAELAVPTGVEAELTDKTYVKKITVEGTGTVVGAGTLYLFQSSVAGWWNTTQRLGCNVLVYRVSAEPGNDIKLDDKDLTFDGNADRTITMTHDIDIGAGTLGLQPAAGKKYTLDMAGGAATFEQLVVGAASGTGSGIFKCGEGVITVGAGGIARGHEDNSANEFHFDSANIVSGGDINLLGFTAITNVGAKVIGGTLTNVVVTGTRLNATQGVEDGGGNENVKFKGAGPTSTTTTTVTGR